MVSKYDISTKDKKEMSYRAFVFALLINLGFNPSNKGTFYLRDLILLAIRNNADIWLKELRKQLASKKHISQMKIKTNIDYAFKCIDSTKTKNNFKNIFHFEYDIYFMTAKTLINLVINLIYPKSSYTQKQD